MILLIVFFSFGLYFSNTKCVFKLEYYLKIKNLLYSNQETVKFDNILRYEIKIRKYNYFVEEIFFRFYMGFFRVNKLDKSVSKIFTFFVF